MEARALVDRGYVRIDRQAGAIIGAFVRHGLFRAGATLIGSHAFGALLNELGVRAAAFVPPRTSTSARGRPLTLGAERRSFQAILEDSTISLVAVPGFDSAKSPRPRTRRVAVRAYASISSRQPAVGTSRSLAVAELAAHATALPHLGRLLDEPIDGRRPDNRLRPAGPGCHGPGRLRVAQDAATRAPQPSSTSSARTPSRPP